MYIGCGHIPALCPRPGGEEHGLRKTMWFLLSDLGGPGCVNSNLWEFRCGTNTPIESTSRIYFRAASREEPPAPRRLPELACQSLRGEASAIAALEPLPVELFPPLFTAFAGKHSKVLKAMGRLARPCLPLGALMIGSLTTISCRLRSMDWMPCLPRRLAPGDGNCIHQEFWIVWAGTRADVCSLLEPEAPQPKRKRGKVGSLRAGLNPLWPRGGVSRSLSQERLYSVQEDLEVSFPWKLSTLRKFAPYLGQKGRLHRFLLSRVFTSSRTTLEQEEQCVSLSLSRPHLQALYLDDVSFLRGRLDQILRCLKIPWEALPITNYLLLERD
ncbi:hypothetical protein QTO34_014329 [Cnephaeus nilssonii]|uniref:Uncharacterized protein n=1 Tax=Cnephaeus nilssonii TaxID=3371016 RepID=A0AA40I702_CNENI|nr:hypothetical protein QTO34_014329 [Eptesicus nilssonii]